MHARKKTLVCRKIELRGIAVWVGGRDCEQGEGKMQYELKKESRKKSGVVSPPSRTPYNRTKRNTQKKDLAITKIKINSGTLIYFFQIDSCAF